MNEPIEATDAEFDMWITLKKQIVDLESRLKAAMEIRPCGKHPQACWVGNPNDSGLDDLIGQSGYCPVCRDAQLEMELITADYLTMLEQVKRLNAEVQAAYERGSNWMLDAIRGTLKGYPNHGGDIEVMREVERIEKAAYERGLRDAVEYASAYLWLGEREAILALKDRGAKGNNNE